MAVEFHDFSVKCKGVIGDKALQWLEESSGEIESTAISNTPVDTGQLKGAWAHKVDSSKYEAVVGNPLEYSIWQEFGTGEFALESNGRKGGWFYIDDKGKGRFTYGNKPVRMLHNAFVTKKSAIINRAKQVFKGL